MQSYASELGREVTHFAPVRYGHEGWRSKTYRNVKQNEKHITADGVDEALEWLEFCCVGQDADIVMSPVSVGLRNSQGFKGYGVVFSQFEAALLIGGGKCSDFLRRFIIDLNGLLEVGYGLVTLMKGKKYPGVYFNDLTASVYLSPEEKENAKIWESEGSRFKTIVRGAYWGNILSRRHWGHNKARERRLIEALKRHCEENVFWIDDEIVFFCAPFDIADQRVTEKTSNEFTRKLHDIFVENGLEVLGPQPKSKPVLFAL